jgi:hypothetical protein
MKVWKMWSSVEIRLRGGFTDVNLGFRVLDLELLDISMFSQSKRWLA